MYRVITPARMQKLEKEYIAAGGTPGLVLMELAAQAIADTLAEITDKGALFLCGPGNNGGDGYAAARLWARPGRKAWVWALSDPEKLTGDARTNWSRCVSLGIPVQRIATMPRSALEGCGALVDALFGTGLDRPLEGLYADAVHWMNASPLPTLAVDIPSGTPELMVRARETVTFHQIKLPHLLFPGRKNAGHITVADIGLPYDNHPDDYEVLQAGDERKRLPPRQQDAHKGDAGRVLVLAGSQGMAGAAALCAGAAIRGGAGLVTVACPEPVIPIVQTLTPCATCIQQDWLEFALDGVQAIAAGPGLGQSDALDGLLRLLLDTDCPQVWDADALNWLAKHPRQLGGKTVITPHPGEAARLLGCDTTDILADMTGSAQMLAARFGAVVLLKGATTVIWGQGKRALNETGSPGMATGGSGDVLTGLIAALLAQGLPPFDAAQLAAMLHGLAGEDAAERRGIRSMNASDLLDSLFID